MNKSIAALFICMLSMNIAFSQVAPQPSPGASFSQTVGITEVKVEYSRPGVKGRKIFGGLLPYGNVWRTGANAATKISFSSDVFINEMPLSAGRYAIMTIPGENSWELIFSKDLDVTESTYNQANDALRILVKPYKTDFTESFTINISDVHEDMAQLNMYWEHTGISAQIRVNNETTIKAAIEAKNNEAAGAFMQAAEYMVNRNINLNLALEYIDKSISLQETFRNTWIKSMILRKAGNKREALKMAVKAQTLGQADPVYSFFKEPVETAIEELKKEFE